MYCLFIVLLINSIHAQNLFNTRITLTATGYEFQSVNMSLQLLNTVYVSTRTRCATACAQTGSCRTFDYDPSLSGRCRLFEADLTTGQITPSLSSSTSIVGSTLITNDLFASFGQSPCGTNCGNGPYLSCNSNNTCQCQGHTYWNGATCNLQKFTGAPCNVNNECRVDLNLSCLQFFQCGSSSVLVGTTVGGYGNGTAGSNAMGLNGPDGIYVTSNNDLYVADSSGSRVQRFSNGSRLATTIGGSGASGSSSSQLNTPVGIFIDEPTAGVYIADSSNKRIQFWAQNATQGITVAGNQGDLGYTYGVRIDNNSYLYASDYSNSRVMRWLLNTTVNGTIVAGGSVGSGPWSFNYPREIVFDPTYQYLYIADANNHRIQMYNLVNTSMTPISAAGNNGVGTAANQLYRPSSLCVSRKTGALYIADTYNHRVQRWYVGATQGVTVAGSLTSVSGLSATQLAYPSAVALDFNETYLYVSDYLNNRVQRFQLI